MSREADKDEALRLAREHSWPEQRAWCRWQDCKVHLAEAERFVHVLATDGFCGMDLTLTTVETLIRDATSLRWISRGDDHDLEATSERWGHFYLHVLDPREGHR